MSSAPRVSTYVFRPALKMARESKRFPGGNDRAPVERLAFDGAGRY